MVGKEDESGRMLAGAISYELPHCRGHFSVAGDLSVLPLIDVF